MCGHLPENYIWTKPPSLRRQGTAPPQPDGNRRSIEEVSAWIRQIGSTNIHEDVITALQTLKLTPGQGHKLSD